MIIQRVLNKMTAFDLVLIAMMAVLGIAIKPIVVPLTHMITGPLYIPGGVVAGGFYMLWLVLGHGLVQRAGTATLIGIVQAILVLSLGIFGTHGVVSLVTYIAPGVAVDLLYLVVPRGSRIPLGAFWGGALANMTGTLLVSFVFFRLPWIPLLLSVCVASLSGGLGGLVAYGLLRQLQRFELDR